MRWKQFFTPVKSYTADEARQFMGSKTMDEVNLVDVRQPSEYETAHIPGSKLIPLPDLNRRMDELDPKKPTVVY